MPASAKPGSFSISAICTVHEAQPAPSLKYRMTGSPRSSDRVTLVPAVVGRVKSGARRVSSELAVPEVARA